MTKITIKNIGALKDVSIDLNKVNVIIGPQSSGKSTIAKIVSYCQWAEKRFILDGKFEYEFSELFMNFHRIDKSYFNQDSLIEYKGDYVNISYKGIDKKFNIKKAEGSHEFLNYKNIYIPAERNFVAVIPNLGRYKETNDNIMNFLYDWFEAKKKYTSKNKFSLLNLNASYHNENGDDIDKIVLENKKELLLNNASSGLQSVTPLLVLVDYLSKTIYNETTLSAKENELLKMTIKPLTELRERIKVLLDGTDVERLKEVGKISNEVDLIEKMNLETIHKQIYYHYTQFIIEEPEQNLFPITQRDLMYYLINVVLDKEHNHKLLITTHSPFILYALNNCMMGYNVKDKMPKDVQSDLKSNTSWIDPKLVSVWEIDSGTLKSIKNPKTGTVDKHYFNNAMNEIMDEYYEMLDYLEL